MKTNLHHASASNETQKGKQPFFRAEQILPKLTVNDPKDRYEPEAHAVADQIMRMADLAGPQPGHSSAPNIQRQCAECEGEVQRSAEDEIDYGDYRGTGAKVGAIIGGLAGIVGGILGGIEIFEATNSLTWGILGGLGIGAAATGLGALIGLGIGAAIDRPAAADCDEEKVAKLNTAKTKAVEMLDNALSELSRSTTSDHVRQALWLMFRSDTEETVNTVQERLQNIRSRFPSIPYQCATPASEKPCSYFHAFVSDHSVPVYLCEQPFAASYGEEDFAKLLIHEAGHLFYRSIIDHGYHTGYCHDKLEADVDTENGNPNAVRERATEGDPPAERLTNADSYSCFVSILADSRLRSDNATERAEGIEAIDERYETRRGNRMRLTRRLGHMFSDDSRVSLDADPTVNPEEFDYQVVDRPQGTSLRFQWQMYLGPDTKGEPIELEGNEASVDFQNQVPAIKQRGASRGTLRCIVTIPGIRGDDPTTRIVDLPLNFLTTPLLNP